jgi:hypothetical protein
VKAGTVAFNAADSDGNGSTPARRVRSAIETIEQTGVAVLVAT